MTADADLLLREGWRQDSDFSWVHPARPLERFTQARAMAAQEAMEVVRRTYGEPAGVREAVGSTTSNYGESSDREFQDRVARARRIFDGEPRGRPLTLEWLASVLAQHQPTSYPRGTIVCRCGQVVRARPPHASAGAVEYAEHQAEAVRVAQMRLKRGTLRR